MHPADPPFPLARACEGTWEVPDGWQQGRGAWGGIVVATAVRAAEDAEAVSGVPGRPVRAISLQIMAPVPVGPIRVDAALARRGSATATWRVEMTGPSDDGLLAHAVVVLGDDRAADLPGLHGQPPQAPPWAEIAALPIRPPLGPVFAAHLDFRVVTGLPYAGAPIAGDDRPEVLAWVRPAVSESAGYDAGALLGLVDALWPTLLVAQTVLRPMTTLSYDAALLVDPASVDPAEPLLFRSWFVALQAGYFTEVRQLWTAGGRLAVHNTQAMVVIR